MIDHSYLADLHVHSRYSRATSPECTLEGLHRWAQLKGVRVVATGDCTHPAWFAELTAKLVPAESGLYRLRDGPAAAADAAVPPACRAPVRFVIGGEISSIYTRDGRGRRVHNLVFAPDLATAGRINARLAKRGNIHSDGRPILGMDPRDLLELILSEHEQCVMIPAHIWTPWFALLGSKSGFDSVAAAFGDLAPHIFAAETGLSSDPPMNWRVSQLDRLALVSNSDLHSPANLGRNANRFHGTPDYFALFDGLRRQDPAVCGGTIDLFPEEGKYHLDGHRACGFVSNPESARQPGDLCPVCGRPLVLGVLHRVVELADRADGGRPAGALPFRYIVPLAEVLAELFGCGATSKRVTGAYFRLLATLGPELSILLDLPAEQLDGQAVPRLGEAIRRMRAGQVVRQGGYDGVYGVIRVLPEPGGCLGDKPASRLRRECSRG